MIYLCKTCGSAWELTRAQDYFTLLKPAMSCPNTPFCTGTAKKVARLPARTKLKKLKTLHFFQATEGLGLPGERKCDPDSLRKILIGCVITDVSLELNGERSLITTLTTDQGVIFLAPSSKGVTIYRMKKHAV